MVRTPLIYTRDRLEGRLGHLSNRSFTFLPAPWANMTSRAKIIRILPAMPIQSASALNRPWIISARNFLFHSSIAFAVLPLLVFSSLARSQEVPTESYGPYNAVFLTDGPGLTKQLAAPSPLDSRTAALLDRLGLNKEPDQRDALLDGRAAWTLAFWFSSSRTAARFSAVGGYRRPSGRRCSFHRNARGAPGSLAWARRWICQATCC